MPYSRTDPITIDQDMYLSITTLLIAEVDQRPTAAESIMRA